MEVPPEDDRNRDFLLQPPRHVANSLTGRASGPVVQAGVIQNVTFNYQGNSAPTEAARSSTTPLLGTTVPRTRDAIAKVRRTRPNLWEHLLYAGELCVGMEHLQAKRLDYQLGHCLSGRVVLDAAQASSYLDEVFRDLLESSAGVERWMSQEAQDRAFGLPGEPGDPELIAHIAKRLLGVYESLMDSAISLRSVRPPSEMVRLFELAALYPRDSIEEFQSFVETLARETDGASATLAKQDGSVAHITVTYTMSIDPDVTKEFETEERRVASKLRKLARRR